MKKSIKKFVAGALAVSLLTAGVVGLSVVVGDSVAAQSITDGVNDAQGAGTPGSLFGEPDSIFTVAVNILLYVIGGISVVMLIVGGIRYTVSNGDSNQITAAKNTIMYAIIGLIIAFLAYAIVNWILGSLGQAN